MTDLERSILKSLVELDKAAKAMATAKPKPDLFPMLARLDELTSRLPKDTAADLVHYLHRKSYEKARLWLEGRDAEDKRGHCAH